MLEKTTLSNPKWKASINVLNWWFLYWKLLRVASAHTQSIMLFFIRWKSQPSFMKFRLKCRVLQWCNFGLSWCGCWHLVDKVQTFPSYKNQIRRETVKFKGIRNSAEVGALTSYLWNTSSIPKLNSGKNLRIKSICLPVRLICLAINSTLALPRNTSLGVIDSLFPVTTLFS